MLFLHHRSLTTTLLGQHLSRRPCSLQLPLNLIPLLHLLPLQRPHPPPLLRRRHSLLLLVLQLRQIVAIRLLPLLPRQHWRDVYWQLMTESLSLLAVSGTASTIRMCLSQTNSRRWDEHSLLPRRSAAPTHPTCSCTSWMIANACWSVLLLINRYDYFIFFFW